MVILVGLQRANNAFSGVLRSALIDIKIDYLNQLISYTYSVLEMSWPQNRLVDISLPEFILDFNNNCVSLLLPQIEAAIKYVENAQGSVLFLLLLILIVQILRTSLMKAPSQPKQAKDSFQARQIGKEVKDLKRELKSIQNMIIQIKNANPSKQNGRSNATQSTRQLIESCKQSWRKREELATQISDWQLKLIKEVITLKNKNRSSRSKINHSSAKQLSLPAKKSPQSSINNQPEHGLIINKPLFKSQIKQQETKKIQTFIETTVSIIKQQAENSQIKIEKTVFQQNKSTKIQILESTSVLNTTEQEKVNTQNQTYKTQVPPQLAEQTNNFSEKEPPKSTKKFIPPKSIGRPGKVPLPAKKPLAPPLRMPKDT